MTVMGSRADMSWTHTGLTVLIGALLRHWMHQRRGHILVGGLLGHAGRDAHPRCIDGDRRDPVADWRPTTTDPCMLVTPHEASTLTGGSFSAGQEQTTSGNGKQCSYGGEGIALEVLFGIAASASVAAAGEQAWKAELEKASGFGHS